MMTVRRPGFWVGGQPLCFRYSNDLKKFHFMQAWLDRDNIVELTKKCMQVIHCESLDLISLDLDGNDIYFVEVLLRRCRCT